MNYTIFIQPLTSQITFTVFWSQGEVISTNFLEKGNEFEHFLPFVTRILSEHHISLGDIAKIWVVNGPWAFTLLRIITLTVNTWAFVYKMPIVSIDLFQLWTLCWYPLPYAIKANRGEYLCFFSEGNSPELSTIENLPEWKYWWIGDNADFLSKNTHFEYSFDNRKVFEYISLKNWTSQIEPVYIKKPNITQPKSS